MCYVKIIKNMHQPFLPLPLPPTSQTSITWPRSNLNFTTPYDTCLSTAFSFLWTDLNKLTSSTNPSPKVVPSHSKNEASCVQYRRHAAIPSCTLPYFFIGQPLPHTLHRYFILDHISHWGDTSEILQNANYVIKIFSNGWKWLQAISDS